MQIRILGFVPGILTLAAGISLAQDFEVYQKRYIPMGCEDPATALAEALARSDEEWEAVGGESEIKEAPFQSQVEAILKRLLAVSHRPTLDAKSVCLPSYELSSLSDDELAFVLAHGLAHVLANHDRRRADLEIDSYGFDIPPTERDLLVRLHHRLLESEADALAVSYYTKAGFRSGVYGKALDALRRCGLEEGELSAQEAILHSMDEAAKEIVKFRAECERLGKLYRSSPSPEVYLQMAAANAKLTAAHVAYDRWSQAYYQNAIAVVGRHPERADREKVCRAMESLLQGKEATSSIARYVYEVLSV